MLSELHNGKTRDTLEVAGISRRRLIAKRQGGSSDQEVSERNQPRPGSVAHRQSSRPAAPSPWCRGTPSSRPAARLETIRGASALPASGTVDAVNEFGQANRGECSFLVADPVYDLLDQLLDRIAAPLGGDHHPGVDDQSHAGGFNGSRWLLMASSRSHAKSSSSVAVEACSLASRRDSESRRTCGSAARITATGRVSSPMTISPPARTRASSAAKSGRLPLPRCE